MASDSDLTVLTTPVAYLGRLPVDTFALPQNNKRFRYYNAVQVAPETGLKITSTTKVFEGYVIGLLIGYGPNNQDLRPEIEVKSSTILSTTGEANLIPYDSTNGTKSLGDMYTRLP